MRDRTWLTRALTPTARPRHRASDQRDGQQHPIKLYLVVWGWLFVLSTFSYLVDYFHLQGYLRWSLILLFMMLKAGLIVAVFMRGRGKLRLVSGFLIRRPWSLCSSPSWCSNRTTRCSSASSSSRQGPEPPDRRPPPVIGEGMIGVFYVRAPLCSQQSYL